MADSINGHIQCDDSDAYYGGARQVVEAELKHLRIRRKADPDNLKGIALSGGGIRSASFCLGIVQALAKYEKLKKFDYMSTVSGGGYIGGALSWLWLGKWRTDKDGNKQCEHKFDTDYLFPFGTGFRHTYTEQSANEDHQASLLRHLRQHGKYLIPGRGITALSFLSVVLRSVAMGFITLMVFASLLFHALYYLDIGSSVEMGVNMRHLSSFGVIGVAVYIASLLIYGVISIFVDDDPEASYTWRRGWESYINVVFGIMLLTVLVSAIPLITDQVILLKLEQFTSDQGITGSLITLAGGLFAWFSQWLSRLKVLKNMPGSVLIYLGTTVFFIGLLVLANHIAVLITDTGYEYAIEVHIGVAVTVLLLAALIPINKVSIHRYYRDRLMETFTPDVCDVIAGADLYRAERANTVSIHNCLPDNDNTMPYHIINTNVILVESNDSKYRNRGGDNFILSPLYCGSTATGWLDSERFAGDSVTLPTAVAISGAAANSDSGVAGKGVTINPLVSAIMTIFNLRLGYWTVNPDTGIQANQSKQPNYFIPGIWGLFGRKMLNEQARYVQLSDGGHFENLAIYELIRRRCRLIVCCDAEQDKKFVYEGLTNIINKARVDFGTCIDVASEDLDKLRYRTDENNDIEFAEQAYIVADILYPNGSIKGKLVYIKSTLPADLSADVAGYKKLHPDFPDETTIDQFFDEQQFEAYRTLGMHIGEMVAKDKNINW